MRASRIGTKGNAISRRYQLLRGGEILGVVTFDPDESDFPWYAGRLELSPAFAEIQPLFCALAQHLKEERFDEESETLFEQVMAPGVQMRSLDDGRVSEVVGINIAGDQVSWR
jgi:hypothetical protein